MKINYKNKLTKILILLCLLILPFSIGFGEEKLASQYLDDNSIGFYQTETCEISLFDFWKSNFNNQKVVIKNDIVSSIECFGKVNGVDKFEDSYFVYIGTNLNINLILQSLMWLTFISFIKLSDNKNKASLVSLIFLSFLFTSQILSEENFYSYYNKNYNNTLSQDNYFLLSIFIAFFIIIKLIDDIISPRLSNLINYFPFIFLIIGTFSSSNINFYILVLCVFGLKNINIETLKSRPTFIYLLFSIVWFINIKETKNFFDVDKLRGFISSSNSMGSLIFWVLIFYLIINGLFYILKTSKKNLNLEILKNNFLISGSAVVLFGLIGAFSTYANFINFYLFGQNKKGMNTFTSVAGNTWRGFSASAEAIGEFYGIAILIALFVIYERKSIKTLEVGLIFINIYGLYKSNDIAVIVSMFIIIFYFLVSKTINLKNYNFKIRYIILFLIIFVLLIFSIYSFFNPGLANDYEFLSQNLLIESLKNSALFEDGGNPYIEDLIYRSNYIDIKKLDTYEEKTSSTTKFLIDNYISTRSDRNINYLPNFTSLLSISSSLINRTEKWSFFVAKYSPSQTELLFGSGPFQLNNYYFSQKLGTRETIDYGLVLPHSTLLDGIIFFGLFGMIIIFSLLIYNYKSNKINIFYILGIFLLINLLKSDSILYLSSFVLLFIIFFLSKHYEDKLEVI
tara:strand:- start:907 stop:2949 length:2043 start_codon:yes stop_codon:yes gene_type:complete